MEQQTFDKLRVSAEGFHSLLDTQYHLIIGRKGKSVDLTIEFKPIDFHHLMGLGKLKDLRIATQNRESVFCEILNGTITYSSIHKSRYIGQIENRFTPLSHIEQILDSNRLIFRYNKKQNQFSLIEADYLLSTDFSVVPFFQKKRKIIQLDSHNSLYSLKKKSRSVPERKSSSMTGSLKKINPQTYPHRKFQKKNKQINRTGCSACPFSLPSMLFFYSSS